MSMDVKIKAREREVGSRGRTSKISLNRDEYEISLVANQAHRKDADPENDEDYDDEPEWFVDVSGETWDNVDTWSRDEPVKTMDYQLFLRLTPDDVSRIVSFAIDNKLVKLKSSLKIVKPEGG
jgi:hypothetical protein